MCNIGRLAFAETRFITIRAKSSFAGTYRNTATVTATNDTNPDDNTSTAVVEIKEVSTQSDYHVQQQAGRKLCCCRGMFTYSLP